MISVYFIYFLSLFSTLFPSRNFQKKKKKRMYAKQRKRLWYSFITRFGSNSIWMWVNMPSLVFFFLKFLDLCLLDHISVYRCVRWCLRVQPLLLLSTKWLFDFQITYLSRRWEIEMSLSSTMREPICWCQSTCTSLLWVVMKAILCVSL